MGYSRTKKGRGRGREEEDGRGGVCDSGGFGGLVASPLVILSSADILFWPQFLDAVVVTWLHPDVMLYDAIPLTKNF